MTMTIFWWFYDDDDDHDVYDEDIYDNDVFSNDGSMMNDDLSSLVAQASPGNTPIKFVPAGNPPECWSS